jgi:hypothetical protein
MRHWDHKQREERRSDHSTDHLRRDLFQIDQHDHAKRCRNSGEGDETQYRYALMRTRSGTSPLIGPSTRPTPYWSCFGACDFISFMCAVYSRFVR